MDSSLRWKDDLEEWFGHKVKRDTGHRTNFAAMPVDRFDAIKRYYLSKNGSGDHPDLDLCS